MLSKLAIEGIDTIRLDTHVPALGARVLMTGITEMEFLLPRDVVICPVEKLSAANRRQITCRGEEYAVSRPHLGIPSKLIDRDTALLLGEFERPTSIVDAVARFSKTSAIAPLKTPEASFEALRSLIAAQILVPGSELETPQHCMKGRIVPGMEIAGCEIVRAIQALDDCGVYEAISRDRRTVAIKVVPKSAPATAHRMLLREAQALRILNGSCAPALLGKGACNGDTYLILEWVGGRDIASETARLRLGGVQHRPALYKLCVRLLRCFAELHQAGITHGDVHPRNIVVSQQGGVRLLDFGRCASARIVGEFSPRAGTGQYYEPELARQLASGEMPCQPSDLGEQFAVAALIYELLTGQSYTEFSLERDVLLEQVMHSEPRPFALLGLPPWPAAEATLLRALAKDPSCRFSSMSDFLERFLTAEIPRPFRPVGGLFLDSLEQQQLPNTIEVAWFLLRAAMIRENPLLLAKAGIIAEGATASGASSAAVHYLRARIAHARSVSYSRALQDFSRNLAPQPLHAEMPGVCWFLEQGCTDERLLERAQAYFAAATPTTRNGERSALWLRVARLLASTTSGELPSVLRELAKDEKNWSIYSVADDVAERLRFWAQANQMVVDETCRHAGEHVALACLDAYTDERREIAARSFALLEWYRCTGDPEWLSRTKIFASRLSAVRRPSGICWIAAQLHLELEKPETAESPFLL